MFFLSTAKIKSVVNHKKYLRDISARYDAAMAVLNGEPGPELSLEVFARFGIHTLRELEWYLEKHSEYGGYIHVPWTEELVLLPLHHDFINAWLRFDNPRVVTLYDRLYESRKEQFHNRTHFDRKRFDIEEDLQLNNWTMPPLDQRMLASPVNGCWDRPELVARFLELQGFQVQRLSCHDGHVMRGHCFVVYTDGNFWMTTSAFPVNLKCKSYRTMCRRIFAVLKHLPIYSDRTKCRLVEFGPPRPGMTTRQYLSLIENGTTIL